MADTIETKKRNWIFIIGVLIMCVGMQVANYGTAVCLSGVALRLEGIGSSVETLWRGEKRESGPLIAILRCPQGLRGEESARLWAVWLRNYRERNGGAFWDPGR